MNKTFITMKQNVATEAQDNSSVTLNLIGFFLNRRYNEVLKLVNWNQVVDYTFNTVAGQQNYVLPDDFLQELYAVDTTSSQELTRVEMKDISTNYADELNTNSLAKRYVIVEDTVKVQPTSAGAVTIVSSSASDTDCVVTIRGISSGSEVVETITINGTTNATGTVSFSRIKSISKSQRTIGTITVTCNSQTISVFSPEKLTSNYTIMRLHYIPASVVTINMPYQQKAPILYYDGDYPIIDISDLLEIGALADLCLYKRQHDKAQSYNIRFEKLLADHIWKLESQPNKTIQFQPITFNREDLC